MIPNEKCIYLVIREHTYSSSPSSNVNFRRFSSLPFEQFSFNGKRNVFTGWNVWRRNIDGLASVSHIVVASPQFLPSYAREEGKSLSALAREVVDRTKNQGQEKGYEFFDPSIQQTRDEMNRNMHVLSFKISQNQSRKRDLPNKDS